jgi:hypothetical protein
MTNQPSPTAICCPPFDPEPWHDKTHQWENKRFLKDHVFTMFFIPFGFGRAMKRLNNKVEAAGASMPGYLCLSDHTSKWNMDLYLAVDQLIPDATNVALSGTFYSRVYEGSFNDTGKWHADFKAAAMAKGLTPGKVYMWYTTCPKCAKKYGKNYVVIIAGIK